MIEPLTPSQMDNFKAFVRVIFQEVVKPMHSELLAHVIAIQALKNAFPDFGPSLDVTLAVARDTPELQEKMHNEYHVNLEKLLDSFHESTLELKSLESFVAQWRDRLN